MNIKRKYIGSKVYDPITNQMYLIEKGKEDFYYRLGLDIFTKPRKPKLQKSAKTTKRRSNNVRNNSNGTNNDK